MQLHYFPGNASMAPHLLLEELGTPYELKLVDRTKNEQKAPDYLRLNPNGLIPVLIDGELVLYETAAICLYLVDANPDAGFAPPFGTHERAHFNKRLIWFSNTMQAALALYFYPERWVDTPEAAAQVKAHAETKVGTMLDQLDAELAERGGPWLMGERYSALDPYAFMLCRWTRGFARPARGLPRLGTYLQAMLARPAVQRVFEQEKLPAPFV